MHEKISTKVGQIHNKGFPPLSLQFVRIPTHFLKLKKITADKNRSTNNYMFGALRALGGLRVSKSSTSYFLN